MRQTKCFPGRVIFDHLPKTAGQAVNAWLQESLGTGCVTNNLIGKHSELIREYGGEYSIISGHVGFDEAGFDPRYDYMTCFREPVDRAISWIYFVLNNHSDEQIVDLRAGVKLFLETEGNKGTKYVLCNAMTEHLCSIHGVYPDDPMQRVECALSVVDEYTLWGFYERLPEFISDFSAFLQVPAPLKLAPVNTTRLRPKILEIPPRIRARLEELNALDIVLYERLQGRYEEARRCWQRPAVAISKWVPLPKSENAGRKFCAPDFTLISISHEGGDNVAQNGVLTFALKFSLALPAEVLVCGLHIHDSEGRLAFLTNSTLTDSTIVSLAAGTHVVYHTIVAALPEGRYNVGFTFIEKKSDVDRELAWLDKIAYFQVTLERCPACEGYVSLPVSIWHQQQDQVVVRLPGDGLGLLSFEKPLSQVAAGEQWMQPITLHNQSTNVWQSILLNPICISYHWLSTSGDLVEFDGLCSALPGDRLNAGEYLQMEMAIKAPDQPGKYLLQALPVMANHAWFDAIGFTPGVLEIEVL